MKATIRHTFDIDGLRELAGEKVFARGEEYHRDGLVTILSIERNRVLAQVAGTEDYRVELSAGKSISGECSCPAFVDWGFCKHMVATALAANDAGGDTATAGALTRIRDHLKGKGIDALVEMIVELAERDPQLFRRLDLAAATVRADDKTVEARLRKAIDAATRTQGFVEYREAATWAAGVESALDAIADLPEGGRAAIALKLADHAIERIGGAIEQIDDSDGHLQGLLGRARDIHLAAVRIARPEPVALTRVLFAREMEDDFATFDGAASLYADVLGKAGLAEYRRLAQQAWEKLPALTGAPRGAHEYHGGYDTLIRILDGFAEREGDLAARIALRSKDLSASWNYHRLARFCLDHGREEEALRRAEEGLWLFEGDRPDERLLFLAVDLLVKSGRTADAEARLWTAFERQPNSELYARLRKLGGKAARDRAVAFLEARLGNEKRTLWNHPAELLVRILIDEKQFDAAWAAAQKYGISPQLKDSLARATEKTHPREALATHTERIEQFANQGGNPAYEEVAALVARMAKLHGPQEHAAYVAALKTRFGRKRNLMALLR